MTFHFGAYYMPAFHRFRKSRLIIIFLELIHVVAVAGAPYAGPSSLDGARPLLAYRRPEDAQPHSYRYQSTSFRRKR